ncbi:zinc finger mym-type protein 5-like protein [Lasius niger]|uniref:Zinc finger mym-type protein 5-like protein n=1 Tax=Lasius niger TaxID=67767 RepID=A0A0J7N4M3_LASNI|nr:zinc finger mym-type protein 5-like protein [Lasius niger]
MLSRQESQKKKPSAAHFRKQKREKEKQKQKLAGSLMKFLNKPETKENQETQDSTTSMNITPDPESMDVFEENSATISSHSSESESSNLEEIIDEYLEESSANNYNISFDDPVVMGESFRKIITTDFFLMRKKSIEIGFSIRL